jgi:DNA-binding MarR family transcriptional regulator
VSSASTARQAPANAADPDAQQPAAGLGPQAAPASPGAQAAAGLGPQAAAADPQTAMPGIDVARLRVAVARLSRRLRKHELAGLTPTKLSALATVWQAGPLRLGDLAAAERIAPSTLTRLVSSLEESGYVERLPVPGDARASTLAITPLGRDVLERISAERTTMLRESLMTLSPQQLAALAAALPALEQLAEATPGERERGREGGEPPGTGPR